MTDKFNLEKGDYRVTWKGEGSGFFAVWLHSGDFKQLLVNEILPSPNTSQALVKGCADCGPTEVGVYYLEVKGSPDGWNFTFDPI